MHPDDDSPALAALVAQADLDEALIHGAEGAPAKENRYTRNPIEVEARQFFRYNGQDLADWCNGNFQYLTSQYDKGVSLLSVPGRAGNLDEGSWLVKQPDGMFIGLSDIDFQDLYTPLYPSPTEDDTNGSDSAR